MASEITGLEEVIGYKTMSRTVQMFPYEPSALGALFPEDRIGGDTAEWDVYKRGRGIAEANVRDGKSKDRALEAVDHKTATCIVLFDNKKLPGDFLNNLRALGSKEREARSHITREAKALTDLHRRTGDYYRALALTGVLTIDQADVKLSIDYGMSSSHQPEVSASWGTASTDIIGDIKTWMDLIQQDAGLKATRAYMNTTVMQYLMKNTAVQKFLGTNAYMEMVGKEGRITRLCGLDLYEDNRGYLDSSGTFTKFIADDRFIITPEPGEWARTQRGTTMVPTDDGKNLTEVRCPAAWVLIDGDPPAIKLLEKDVVLPVLEIPDAVVYATVVPSG